MNKYLFSPQFSTLLKSLIAGVYFSVLFVVHGIAQSLPIGYVNYFSQKANNQLFISTITSCTPQYWNISKDKTCTILYPAEKDSLTPGTFTLNTGVVKDMIFGEYIMEFEFYTTNIPASDSSGFCFIGPVKSADTYYAYVFGSDSLTFYFINKGIPEKIGTEILKPTQKSWNRVRVTRDILNRSVTFVLSRDLNKQVVFTDPRLVMGFVGFGTLTTQSSIRNINIWAPTVITDSTFLCK